MDLDEFAALIDEEAARADLLLAFDEGGITGHPGHICATEATRVVGAARGLPALGWALPEAVAARLNAELGTGFVGRAADELDLAVEVEVDRACQPEAIACHVSQSGDNPVLWRRLELLGTSEHLRWLTPAPTP